MISKDDGATKRPDNVQSNDGIGHANEKATRYASASTTPRATKFEGKSEELKGYVYDCSDTNQPDHFTRTTNEIAEFVGRSYWNGGDIMRAVQKLKLPTLVKPDDPPADVNSTDKCIWEKKVDTYVMRDEQLLENVQKLYSLVWGQCTELMRQQIEGMTEYEEMSNELDGIALIKAIKNVIYHAENQQYADQSIRDAKRRFYNCTQGKHTTNQAYLNQLIGTVEVIEHCGGSVGNDEASREIAKSTLGPIVATNDKEKAALEKAITETAMEQYIATVFFLGADRQRYGKLLDETENSFLHGINLFPMTINAAYNLLNK